MREEKLKQIVEGFLFASDKALTAEQIKNLFPEGETPDIQEINTAIEEIAVDFTNHGIELKKISSGFRFQVRQEVSPWVGRLWEEKPQKYSRALLETLALIVYRQPITRGEIEEIRGVAVSSHIVKTLLERDWVRIVGHKEVPGRPALLATTKQFLDYFNLSSLDELPPLSDIKDLDALAVELDGEQNATLINAIKEAQENEKQENDENSSSKEDVADSDIKEQSEELGSADIESNPTSEDKTSNEDAELEEQNPGTDEVEIRLDNSEVNKTEIIEEQESSINEIDDNEESNISNENSQPSKNDNDTPLETELNQATGGMENSLEELETILDEIAETENNILEKLEPTKEIEKHPETDIVTTPQDANPEINDSEELGDKNQNKESEIN